jgi:hypothetical protein
MLFGKKQVTLGNFIGAVSLCIIDPRQYNGCKFSNNEKGKET